MNYLRKFLIFSFCSLLLLSYSEAQIKKPKLRFKKPKLFNKLLGEDEEKKTENLELENKEEKTKKKLEPPM